MVRARTESILEALLVQPPSSQASVAAADSEQADVALAAAADQAAFERLYRRHVARIHTLVRRMVAGQEARGADPDELTQDVFVRAWQRLGTFRGEAQFGTWLHRLAVNVVLNWQKTETTGRRRFDEGADVDTRPGRRATPEHALDLEEAIAQLPPGARQVFVLHDVEGFRHEEIAGQLGVTAGTTKAQLHRARMLLRELLER